MKFVINLVTPDNGEKFVVEMSNSTLTNIKGVQAKNPDLTVTLNRSDLETVMMGKRHVRRSACRRQGEVDGNRRPFDQLASTMVRFTPDFEMMPGTEPVKAATPPAKDPFEQADLARSDGG